MPRQTDRREFLKRGTGVGLCAAGWQRAALGGSPNGKLHYAAIGVGGKGWSDLTAFASHSEVVVTALCDVDNRQIDQAAKTFPQARRYHDWREMLAEEGDRIDAVSVSTPDHMHAPISMSAINRGKHVFVQKPMTHDIHEARRVTQAAAKAKLATQMGIQINSSTAYRTAVKMIRDGVIGKVKQVHAWSNKPSGKYRPTGPRPQGSDPVPDTVNWDAWLGTAPPRPYKAGVYHPKWWRGWQDFGVGWLGDMGCHIIDTPFQALKLTAPLTIRADVEPEWWNTPSRRSETWPTWQVLHYTFAGNELTAGKTLDFTWSDGGKYPPDGLRKLIDNQAYPSQGSLLIGEAGSLLLPHVANPQLFPTARFKNYAVPQLEPRNHYHHWIDACLGKATTAAGFDYSGPLTETVLLGTVALLSAGEDLKWDAAAMKVTNVGEANRWLHRPYRDGWAVEGF
ncbi:MAG: Gfo/Idh/MocA family oxidoreductase [Fuerstiella sp.]|nr:Gfo/Idh/MocA family oxidoreductase [Fuerstiella sp.]MCP4857344.1 Gfo/Idh/MocA family oxidoreductase [Fuerstiella sp.]